MVKEIEKRLVEKRRDQNENCSATEGRGRKIKGETHEEKKASP